MTFVLRRNLGCNNSAYTRHENQSSWKVLLKWLWRISSAEEVKVFEDSQDKRSRWRLSLDSKIVVLRRVSTRKFVLQIICSREKAAEWKFPASNIIQWTRWNTVGIPRCKNQSQKIKPKHISIIGLYRNSVKTVKSHSMHY